MQTDSFIKISWEDIEPLIEDDKYKSFLRSIDPKTFKLVLDENSRPQVIESILEMLKNQEPENASREYAEKIVNLMQTVAEKIKKTPALTDVVIELHVPNFDVVKTFYSQLGFKMVWEYPPEDQSGYLVMKRHNSLIAFYCGNEDVYEHQYFGQFDKNTVRGYGVEISIYITDISIEDFYAEISSKIEKKYIVQELEAKPWGIKDFRIIDPFGFYLCFREPDNILLD